MRNLQERRAVVAEVAVTARRLLLPAVAAAVVAADQVTKTVALDHLQPGLARHVIGPVNWVLTYNTGAAFGIGTGITPILETGAVLLVIGLLLFSRRAASRASTPAPVAAALGLLLGGALSNLADRIFRHVPGHPGAVVDFIQGVSWWPVFNLADASIVVGVVLLVLTYRPRG